MQEIHISNNEANQRLDKLLHKLLPEAGTSFLYKMLRKKNITLDGKKAEGKENFLTLFENYLNKYNFRACEEIFLQLTAGN
jgi:23S rRNA-/tRNA-specific pseudouridylate synthase